LSSLCGLSVSRVRYVTPIVTDPIGVLIGPILTLFVSGPGHEKEDNRDRENRSSVRSDQDGWLLAISSALQDTTDEVGCATATNGSRRTPIDYRCEDGLLPVSENGVIIQSTIRFSSSKTGVNPGIRRGKKAYL
jgi:hypothetical protein